LTPSLVYRDLTDPLCLARDLVQKPSVTPKDAGALDVLEEALTSLGFICNRLAFGNAGIDRVDNLYARLGTKSPNFAFAGHTDVVPAGEGWTGNPFGAEIKNGFLYGRGTADMKGAIACMVAGTAEFLEKRKEFGGSISFIITGDEEGTAVNGTRKVLEWMATQGENLDACVVGEPTNPEQLGQMIKIGRRGSINVKVTVHGTMGHAAYPHLADNPIPRLMNMLYSIISHPLDDGSRHFQESTITITSFDVDNNASNVIPGNANAAFNVRFNDLHSGESVERWVREKLDSAAKGMSYDVEFHVSGESFLTPPGPLSDAVQDAVESVTGLRPELSTTGGTSDARFIKDACPVCEFGLVGLTMHKANENVSVNDLRLLAKIYKSILDRHFTAG